MKNNTTTTKTASVKKTARVPHQKKPAHLTTAEWQKELRKQYGADHKHLFDIAYTEGEHPVFGDYRVHSVASGTTYKVALRSAHPGTNFCTCLDFKTNTLGTCKHIEAVLARVVRQKKLAPLLREEYRPSYTSVYLKYAPTRTVMVRIGTEHGHALATLAKRYFDDSGALRVEKVDSIETFLSRAARLDPSFRCYDDAMDHLITLRDARARALLFAPEHTHLTKGLVRATLYPYQEEGVLFAARAGRALIADEMGLGKTVQALAFAELLKKERGIRRVLIIAPTSLKYQWQSEIAKFTESASVVVEGTAEARARQYASEVLYTISSYSVVGADREAIEKMEPDLVILDEAQRIKNWDTQTSREVKKIRSPYALVLTGTPLENKLEELYSIVQFLDPFALGPLHAFLERHQTRDELGKVVGYRDLNRIRESLAGVVLRRTKKEVLSQLPERTDKVVFVPLTDEQRDVHADHADTVARLVHRWRRYGFLDEVARRRLMIALNSMRMVADSTYILDEETRHDTKLDELAHILEEALLAGEKVVVFSQWERMTRLVKEWLEKEGVGFVYLHGGVPSKKRKGLLDTFRDDPVCRIFLSTDAGGVGLNLQSASLIVNLDIPWNPAVLEQRIGRIYRHGQKRKVRVINLVSKGSIEERLLGVLSFKSSLFAGALDRGADEVFMGGSKFKQFMEAVEEVATPETPTVDVREGEVMAQKGVKKEQVTKSEKDKTPTTNTPVVSANADSAHVVAQSFGALASAAQALADALAQPAGTQSMLREESGKTYVSIPVEQVESIAGALSAIATLLRGGE